MNERKKNMKENQRKEERNLNIPLEQCAVLFTPLRSF